MPARSAEHINQIACQAVAAMQQHGVVPHPQNYALWYAYYGGRLPSLTAAIDALLAAGKPLTEERCHTLYEQYLLDTDMQCECVLGRDQLQTTIVDALDHIMPPHNTVCCCSEDGAECCDDLREDLVFLNARAVRETHSLEKSFLQTDLTELGEDCRELWQHLAALRTRGEVDAMTGRLSPQVFRQMMKDSMMLAQRRGCALTLAILTVDNIDAFASDADDATPDIILKMLARKLCENVKAQDAVCRLDRQKFAVLMLNTDLTRAERFVDGIRHVVADRAIFNRRTQENLGLLDLYIGLAQYQDGETEDRFMRRAAEAIFTAKAANTPQTIQAV